MRPIDADALKLSMMLIAPGETKKYCYPCRDILKEIDDAPTIEERKTGKWIQRKGMYEIGYKCSECDAFSLTETSYCAKCGAKMEGEQP